MHRWGDDWFKKYGEELDTAIRDLEDRIRKWAKAGVCGKEKWGCYVDEYLTLWDGGITQIFFGYRATYQWNKISKIMWRIDHFLIPYKKTKYGWLKGGLSDFNRLIGLVRIVRWWQKRMINKAFQITCKEHPDIVDELVLDTYSYKMIKPCRWGDIDGEKIHRKYWKKL